MVLWWVNKLKRRQMITLILSRCLSNMCLSQSNLKVSDYEADIGLIDHGFAANESDAAKKALWAGVDMSMQSGLYRKCKVTHTSCHMLWHILV